MFLAFSMPVANAYQKIAKSVYAILPSLGPIAADGHDPTTVFYPPPAPAAQPPPPGAADNDDHDHDIKKPKVFPAINGASTRVNTTTSTTTTTTTSGASGSSIIGSRNGNQVQTGKKKSSLNGGSMSARTSPKPAAPGA
jgi:hypothetical protein